MAKKEKTEIKNDIALQESIPTSELNLEISEAIKLANEYCALTNSIRSRVNDIFSNYLIIGTKLKTINDAELYKLEEYESIYDYASKLFNLSQTTVHNVMAISEKFSDGYGRLLDQYKDYTFSTLVELLSVNALDLEKYSPDMTVKEIRNKKIAFKIDQMINLTVSPIGSVTKVIERIKSYDIHQAINNLDARLSHQIVKDKYSDVNYYSYLVKFVISNLIKPKEFKFILLIDHNGFTLKSDTSGYWRYQTLKTMDEVDNFMNVICKYLYQEAVSALKNKTSNESDTETSNSFYDFTQENRWNMINPILNEVSKNLPYKAYYEHINNDLMLVYKEPKKNKKKNPPLFKIVKPFNLREIKILNPDDTEHEGFKEVEIKRSELMDLIVSSISEIVKTSINDTGISVTVVKDNVKRDESTVIIDYES